MKSTTLIALFLLCAFFFTSYLPSATGAFVLDSDGNPLENGGTYYVPAPNNCGGIEYTTSGNETCPITVVQHHDPTCKGFPITISSPARIRYISEGLNVNIGFTFRPPPCAPSSLWTVLKDQSEHPDPYEGVILPVKLNNEDNSNNTVPGWFKIQKLPLDFITTYYIVFCPLDQSPCWSVGSNFDQYGNRRLVVAQFARRQDIEFQKLSYASRSTHSSA